jgi:TP901 family phage tail tape measure protein
LVAEYKVGLHIGNEWKAAVARLRTAFNEVDGIVARIPRRLAEPAAKSAMKQMETGLDRIKNQLAQIQKLSLEKSIGMTEARQAIGGINNISSALGRLHREGKISTETLMTMNKEVIASRKNWESKRRELHSAGTEVNSLTAAFDRINRRIQQFGSFLLAAMVIRTFYTGIREFNKAIIEFDQSLHNLQAIIKVNEVQAKILGDVIRDVARTTKFSASEVADGMRILGQAGLDMGEAMVFIKGTADLATGTMEDFNQVADLMTSSMNAFHLEAVEGSRIADIYANAINKSKLNIDKLRTAFNYVGAAGYQAGLELNDLAGTLMVLADNGIRASTMGTGLRRMIMQMLAPSARFRAELRTMNIAIEDINPGIVGWETALRNLRPVLWDAQRQTVDMAKTSAYFGLRAAQVAAVILSSEEAISSATQMTYEYGAAAEMAAKQQEGLEIVLKNLSDRLKLIAVGIGEEGGLADTYKGFLNVLRSVSTGLETLIMKSAEVEHSLSNLASRIAVGASQLTFLATAIYVSAHALKFLSLKLGIATGAATLALGKFALIAGVFAAAGAAMVTFAGRSERLKEELDIQAEMFAANADVTDKWRNTLVNAFGSPEWFNAVRRFKDENADIADAIENELVNRGIPGLEYFTGAINDLTDAFNRVKANYFAAQLHIASEAIKAAAKTPWWSFLLESPMYSKSPEAFKEFIKRHSEISDEAVKQFAKSTHTAIQSLGMSFDEVVSYIQERMKTFEDEINLGASSKIISAFINEYFANFEMMARAHVVKLQREQIEGYEQLIKNIEKFIDEKNEVIKSKLEEGISQKDLITFLGDYFSLPKELIEELEKTIGDFTEETLRGQTTLEGLAAALRDLNPEFLTLFKQLDAFQRVEFHEQFTKLIEKTGEVEDNLYKTALGTQTLSEAVVKLGEQSVLDIMAAEAGIAANSIEELEEKVQSIADERLRADVKALFDSFFPKDRETKKTIVGFEELKKQLEETLKVLKMTNKEKELYNLLSKATVDILPKEIEYLSLLVDEIERENDLKAVNKKITDELAKTKEEILKLLNGERDATEDLLNWLDKMIELYRDELDNVDELREALEHLLNLRKALADKSLYEAQEEAVEKFNRRYKEATYDQIALLKLKFQEERDAFKKSEEFTEKGYAALVKAQEAELQNALKNLKRELSEAERIWQKMFDNIQDMNADTIRAMLDGNLDRWEDYADAIIDIMKNTFAQIAAAALQQQVILPIFANVFSGTSMGAAAQGMMTQQMAGQVAGGWRPSLPGSGALNWMQGNVPGMGWLGSAIPGTGTMMGVNTAAQAAGHGSMVMGSGTGTSTVIGGIPWSSALGAGALGGLGYQFLGPSLGLPQSPYSGLTAGVGGALGYAGGAALGAKLGTGILPGVGTVLGALAGGLLGSLMGGGGSQRRPSIGFHPTSHLMEPSSEYGFATRKFHKAPSEAEQAMGIYFESLYAGLDSLMDESIVKLLKQYEVTSSSWGNRAHGRGYHYRSMLDDQTFEQALAEMTGWFFKDYGDALVGSIDGLQKSVLKGLDLTSLETIFADLDFAISFDDSLQSFTSGIYEMQLAIRQAAEQELNQLVNMLNEFMETAKRLGLDTDAAQEAMKEYVRGMVLGRDTMTELEAALYSLEVKFRHLESALISVGYTAEEAAEMALEGWRNAQREMLEAQRDQLLSFILREMDMMQGQVDQIVSQALRTRESLQSEIDRITADAYQARNSLVQEALGLLREESDVYTDIADNAKRAIDTLSTYRQNLFIGQDSPFGLQEQQQMLAGRQSGLAGRALSGDMDAISELLSVNQDYLAVSKQMSSSWIDYAREVGKSAHLMASIEEAAQGELTEAEKQLAKLQEIIDPLEEMVKSSRNIETVLGELALLDQAMKDTLGDSYTELQTGNTNTGQIITDLSAIGDKLLDIESIETALETALGDPLENILAQFGEGTVQDVVTSLGTVSGLLGEIKAADIALKDMLGEDYRAIIASTNSIATALEKLAEVQIALNNVMNMQFTLPPVNVNVTIDSEKAITHIADPIEAVIPKIKWEDQLGYDLFGPWKYSDESKEGGRASGGPVWPGTWLVGEKGPELIKIDQPGYVFNDIETKHILSSLEGARQSGGPVWSGDWLVGERGPELMTFGNMDFAHDRDVSYNELIDEIKKLRAEVTELKLSNEDVASHTSDTTQILNRWEYGGLPTGEGDTVGVT